MGTLVCRTAFEPSQVAGSGWDAGAARRGVEELLERFMEAWRRNDAAALAATFVPTGNLLNRHGLLATGRAEVQQLLTEEFASVMRGTRNETTLTLLHFLTPDTVHAEGEQVVHDVRKPDGTLLTVRMNVSFSARREDEGRWAFVSVRPTMPPKT